MFRISVCYCKRAECLPQGTVEQQGSEMSLILFEDTSFRQAYADGLPNAGSYKSIHKDI